MLEKLSAKIDQENRDLVHVLDKVEDKLMRKEADLQGFQEDSRLKATAPFLKQFIHLGDMMRKVVDENPAGAEASAAYLLEQFKQLTDSIDFILRDFSVDVSRRNEGDMRFDPHTQQAFDYPTDDPALDKKVRRTIESWLRMDIALCFESQGQRRGASVERIPHDIPPRTSGML